jgi:hypothetical protein
MKKITLPAFILTAGLLMANDNAPVGIRPLPDELIQELAEEQKKENVLDQDANKAIGETEEVSGCCTFCNASFYFPATCHWIIALSAFGDSLGIEDGSIWDVDLRDSDLMHYWFPDDPIAITQNTDWFSSYKYRIINKNHGTSIAANLSMGPIVGGEHSLQITQIDYCNGLAILTDSSSWQISLRDYLQFPQWSIGDYIILGTNSGWDSSCPCILINSNMNTFIRAKQY